MKYIIYVAIIISSFWENELHDLPIGFFRMYELDSSIMMNITLDGKEVANVLSKPVVEITLQDFQKYINENSSWKFDSKIALFKINQLSFDIDHFKAIGHLDEDNLCAKKLYISNRILIGVYNQSNIIEINLKERTMDFHMNKKRTEIMVNLDE